MKKIKVNKEVFEALEEINCICTDFRGLGKNEEILRLHSRNLNNKQNKYNRKLSPLFEINLLELSMILLNGYELEKTPEEELLEIYKINSLDDLDKGINLGIEITLKKLNISIKGINA